MNIQIFGKSKCFDTKKAERYFKERRIPFQYIDLMRYGMSGGEFRRVKQGLGGIGNMIDEKSRNYYSSGIGYLAYEEDKEEKLLEDPSLMRTPIVCNGRKTTVGYCPEIWETWE